MSKILAILAISAISTGAFAQSDSIFFEVGMNTVPLMRAFRTDSPITNPLINPNILTVEASFGKVGLRAGFGYQNKSATELPSEINAQTEFNSDTTVSNIRAGLVFYKNFNEKWSVKYGVDVRLYRYYGASSSRFVTSQGEEVNLENSLTTKGTGFSPYFFTQYHITKNISLATEISLVYGKYTDDEFTQSDVAGFTSQIITERKSFFVQAPTALFLIVRF